MPGLDLKNPGGKEILIVGGGALGLALLYFYFKGKTSTAATPAASTGATPVAADGAPFGGSGMRVAGGFSTGNALTDAVAATPVATAASPTGMVSTSTKPARPRLPVLHATQGAQSVLGAGGGGSVPASTLGGAVATGSAQVYQALTKAGLLPYQAAGVLGNIANESSFNVEANAMDTNGYRSYGLIQWNAQSYPNASQYVTGNPVKDLKTQTAAIVNLFRQHGIGGTTAGAVAGNWASQVEVCKGCQPGGAQFNARVGNAVTIFQQIVSGAFNAPKIKAQPVAAKGTKAATAKQVSAKFPTVKPGKPLTGLLRAFQIAVKPRPKAAATARAQNRRGIRAV